MRMHITPTLVDLLEISIGEFGEQPKGEGDKEIQLLLSQG